MSARASRPQQVEHLESLCDEVNENLEPLRSFVLPGGTEPAALLHLRANGLPASGARHGCARAPKPT